METISFIFERSQSMRYYINPHINEPGANQEVHKENCSGLPLVKKREYLGDFTSAREAVHYAKILGYTRADGCMHCSPEAHRG